MNTAMSQQELERMLDQAVREVTEQTAGVRLHQSGEALGGEVCTVHISFHKGFHTSLTLCAETELLAQMARNTIGLKDLNSQDLEDFSKEYFNILCGKIAAILFRTTNVPARFSVPAFYWGGYEPEGQRRQFALDYSDERGRGAQLIHHVPCLDREDAAPDTISA